MGSALGTGFDESNTRRPKWVGANSREVEVGGYWGGPLLGRPPAASA
jgi:hypothetical protein